MHEISVCQGIIDSLLDEFGEDGLRDVREVFLKVGVLSSVEPMVLKHVFTMMAEDSALQYATLQIESIDVYAACQYCSNEFKVDKYIFICPGCGRPSSEITHGNELHVYKVILEEPAYEKII